MLAATVIDDSGTFAWSTVPDPVLQPGEILIDVAAAGVNRADLLQARGRYSPPPGASQIVGLECSGTVSAVHADGYDDAPGFDVGDPVCALLSGGGYAERVAVPVTQVLPAPAGVDLVDAAGLPEAVCTVWSNLVMMAGLSRGQWLLVHGGSSGIGTMAIQIAKQLGAHVAVTASSSDKLAACEELGADVLINYRTSDFVDDVIRETDGAGTDVILDLVGGPYLQRNIEALSDGGRLVVIGLIGGPTAEIDLRALMSKRAAVIGTLLRTRRAVGPGSKAEVVAQVREHVWPLVDSGVIRPVIGKRIAMDRAAEAHQLLRDGDIVGKVVLTRPA